MNTQQAEIDVLKAQVKTLDAALAKQSRTFKRMFYGFGCLLVAGIALAATSMQGGPDVIQAKEFHVVNDEGTVMVGLSADADGGMLTIYNKDGTLASALTSVLIMYNKDEEVVVGLAATPLGGLLTISNKDGKTVARLHAEPDGGKLDIFNKDGKEAFSAPEDFAATVKEAAGN